MPPQPVEVPALSKEAREQIENARPPEYHRSIVLGDMVMPVAMPGQQATKNAARRRFRAAGQGVITSLGMGMSLDRKKAREAQQRPDKELQELLQVVDAQLFEVVNLKSSAAGLKRAERLLHDCAGCDGDAAACVALISSRAISTSHRHDEMLRMIRLFSSASAGNERGKPPPLGNTYDDPVAEYWDMIFMRGIRALLRECLCTQHSNGIREARLQRISNWFKERSRVGRLAGDILVKAPGKPAVEAAVAQAKPPEPVALPRARMGGAHGVTWVCGNNMGEGSAFTPRNSPATHSMGRMPSVARMSLERRY